MIMIEKKVAEIADMRRRFLLRVCLRVPLIVIRIA
jgi:hypothetical protein